ncbi:acyl-phosphate glycerol 3-phosphate acyltransferase [Streptococcus criceti]|uniref:Glycerol-3-phosphate acyltransferase n=1 Tax=Streptococcus criceti HS-6 TaxID=873449 RepID=G5JR10_STRCG|nr:glycerol-3-phosphate 1-O-acyltransferase PlsY [Streptococcus criceti]EHI73475.1 glycerol-3-phosphate O-acyltransferase family protein [Streptococcus criceti HS-6]SUN43012.1 acyl-phosphate glycerol 3-phosphate acyltransferase [Streptococcus criceti]
MESIIFIVIAYLMGSIPSGLWIGKIFYHKNIREYGSGNTGTTNTFRVLGKTAGTVTFLIDMLKGTLAVLLPIWCGAATISPLIIGFFAVIGHTFPIFASFKGGKAVATSAGVLLGFSPLYCLFLLAIFFTILFLTSMISFSSIAVSLLGLVTLFTFPAIHFILPSYDWLFTLVVSCLALIIITRHKDNMVRIRNKEESLVPFGLNLTHQHPKK